MRMMQSGSEIKRWKSASKNIHHLFSFKNELKCSRFLFSNYVFASSAHNMEKLHSANARQMETGLGWTMPCWIAVLRSTCKARSPKSVFKMRLGHKFRDFQSYFEWTFMITRRFHFETLANRFAFLVANLFLLFSVFGIAKQLTILVDDSLLCNGRLSALAMDLLCAFVVDFHLDIGEKARNRIAQNARDNAKKQSKLVWPFCLVSFAKSEPKRRKNNRSEGR